MVGRGVPEALTRPLLFLGLVFAALALVPAGAHLAELPNKIDLPRQEYLAVQQIYRGWARFGVVVLGALLSTGALAFTYPANRATQNWTVLPENWLALRAQWEYSHAASALLNLVALLALAYLAAREAR